MGPEGPNSTRKFPLDAGHAAIILVYQRQLDTVDTETWRRNRLSAGLNGWNRAETLKMADASAGRPLGQAHLGTGPIKNFAEMIHRQEERVDFIDAISYLCVRCMISRWFCLSLKFKLENDKFLKKYRIKYYFRQSFNPVVFWNRSTFFDKNPKRKPSSLWKLLESKLMSF